MSDYTQNTTFATKDSLLTGDPEKIILGADFDGEFSELAARSADKEDTSNKNQASGYAGLDGSSLLTASQLPTATTTVKGAVELANSTEAKAFTQDKIIDGARLEDVLEVADGEGISWVTDEFILALSQLSTATPVLGDEVVFVDNGSTNKVATFTTLNGILTLANLSDYDANDHIDHTTVDVIAGTGLTGGGSIAANRTLNVIGGTGITANANDIDFDPSGLSEITIENFDDANDSFIVSDNGTPKQMKYDDGGIKVKTVTGGTDTINKADMNHFIHYTDASGGVAVTLNTGVGAVGNVLIIKQGGGSTVTIGGTATVESADDEVATRTEDSVIVLVCTADDVWALYGDTA